MSPFGRRQSQSRTPEERERARLERESRRAQREGRPLPAPAEEPAGVEESPAVEESPDGEEPTSFEESPVVDESPGVEESTAAEQSPAPDPVATREEPWDSGDPVSFESNGHHVADDEQVWAPAAPEAPAAPQGPATGEERPAWDDTGAWDPHPPQPAAEPPTPTPAPTLGEEFAAVDRGWFEDDEPASKEPGQETVEWDVLANRPKTRPEPPSGPAGADAATVEWDVMSEAPKPAVPESRQQARSDARAGGGARPRSESSAGGGATPQSEPPAARPAAAPRFDAGAAPRFSDEHERPVPTRRVNRSRTLPPPPPPPGEKRRRGRPRRGSVLAVIALLVLAVVLYLVNALFQPLHDSGSGSVHVTIPANSSAGKVGDVLEREGVVDSAFFFQIRTRLSGENLKAGNFTLKQGMPYGDAIKALSSAPEAPRAINLTIPEGRARRETAPLVKDAGLSGSYLKASERSPGFSPRRYGAPKGTKSLEGFLFPATYELAPDATASDLVAKQVEAFKHNIDQVSMRRARARNLSTYDVLTIASMIEREATLARERRLVAAVIHNRLRESMPLGIDATIRYATRNWSRPLKQSELNIDSPYNTRRRLGLPPTPIGSPGLASIKAAANPANVDYLYYVVKPSGDGAHNFSSTDAAFQKDVEAYNRERAKRGGKDPSSSKGG